MDDACREEAAGALWSLAIDDGNKAAIVAAGALPALAGLVRDARNNPLLASIIADATDQKPPPPPPASGNVRCRSFLLKVASEAH